MIYVGRKSCKQTKKELYTLFGQVWSEWLENEGFCQWKGRVGAVYVYQLVPYFKSINDYLRLSNFNS